MEGPPVNRFQIHVLTLSFQATGQIDVIGNLADFLTDPARDALILSQANLSSIPPGGPIRSMTRPEISIRKPEVSFAYFPEQEAQNQVRLLARTEELVLYTPLAILRGSVHMTAEARINDFLATTKTAYIPITQARLFMLIDLPFPFPQECALLLLNQQYVQLFHTP
ncbi:MAG: hypothetical protein JW900_06985 [Anaerolineae bacterium]|nr:hypothetical protein [Anaerolineae bacterium]